MFESVVSELVMKICGEYVEGLDKDNLNISIWSGNSVIHDNKISFS